MVTKTPKPPDATTAAAAKPAALKVQVKKRDFAAKVAEASGIKAADAKLVIEATLAEMAAALSAKSELVLPPLGRIKVTREKEIKGNRILMLRLQLDAGDTPAKPAKGGKARKQALAADQGSD